MTKHKSYVTKLLAVVLMLTMLLSSVSLTVSAAAEILDPEGWLSRATAEQQLRYAMEHGGTVTLDEDVVLSDSLSFPAGITVTFEKSDAEAAAATYLFVNCDYNSSTEGFGVTKFSNYAGAYAYATTNGKTNATIVVEKTNTLSGNTFDNNHKNYSRLAVVIQDGATMGNAASKWDMTYPVTVEPGGTLTCARPKSASVSNIHIKNTLTVGAAGSDKKAVVDFLSDSYQDCDISIRYNGKIIVNNAIFNVQDLDAQGALTISDSVVTVDGALSTATFYKTTLTNTEMTVNGNQISGGLSDFAGGTANQLGNVTINNSTLTIKDGNTKVAANVTVNGDSAVSVNDLTVNSNKKITVNDDAAVDVAGTLTNNGTIAASADATISAKDVSDASTGKVTINGSEASLGEDGQFGLPAAKIGDAFFTTLEAAFAAAADGDTIVLLADATPALTSQRAITKAAVIDLNGKTLTLIEDDLYFGTTTFQNGTIVVDPSVKPSTAVFWMFANQTLTFDGVKLVATGVTGTYLIGLEGTNSDLNILNGSEIVIENTTALDLDVICVNGSTDNDIVVSDSKVNVTNLDGRVFFRGNYTIDGTTEIALTGITKAGFRIEAGQTLSIEDSAKVTVVGEPRDGGIHLTDLSATYTVAETATVSATVVEPVAEASVNGVKYATVAEAIAAAQNGDTVTLFAGEFAPINISNKNITIQGTVGANGELLTTIKGGNPAITGHGFNGTIKDLKIVDAWKVMYAEPAGNVTVDNVYVTGATYGFHLVAYSTGLTWTIQNSYMDLAWANSFGVYGGDAAIVVKGNVFESTNPYYPDYGALHVNSFMPNVTVQENIFGENAKISIDASVTDTSKINISNNYHADGVDNAFVDDSGVKVGIYQYYTELDASGKIDKDSLVDTRVAKIGDKYYTSLEDAFKAATDGCTIEILADVVVDYYWDARYTGAKFTVPVTIDGKGHTITFKNTVYDGGNYMAAFRFEADATVQNLTIDMTEAQSGFAGRFRAISAKANLTVDNCTFIGNGSANNTRAIIFGEGASTASTISITNSDFEGWRRAIGDNESGKDIATSVVITGNTIKDAGVYVSATTSVTFNNNTVEDGSVDIRSYAGDDSTLAVVAQGNTLDAEFDNKIAAKTIDAQDGFATKYPPYKVSTKAELDAALAAAKDGDVIVLTADIDYGTTQLAIAKAITLDLGTHTLTTRNAYGGMTVKNNATVKNGTIVHASNTAAIKVWNAVAFENLVIDVQGKGDANKTIGGIVLQSGSTTRVGTIKNVTIKGDALTNGIETYNCGDATENVIGSMENVTINAKGTGMLISAPCGTATDCNISGGTNGIEIWVKGNYSATLTLENSEVKGGVYAHDEISNNPDTVNNGTLSLVADEDTKLGDVTLTLARAENVEGKLDEIKDAAKAKVNDTYYATVAAAIVAAQNGDVVTLLADLEIVGETYKIAEGVAITLDMNGKKLTVTDNKASNVSYELFYIYGEMTVIGNGTIEMTSTSNDTAWAKSSTIFHNRGGKLTIENGTFTHLGGTAMAYVVDNNANSYGNATTTVKGGTLTSSYIAIRNRMEMAGYGHGTAILNVEGGVINGTSRAIWAQAASVSVTAPATGVINVSGGEIGLIDTARNAGALSMTTITGGTVAAVKCEVGELTVKGGTVAELTILTADGAATEYAVTADGLYVTAVASVNGVKYATLAEAFAAVTEDNQTVTILSDVTENLVGAYLRGNITAVEGAKVTITLTNTDWVYCPYYFVIGENVTLNTPALFYYAGGATIKGTLITDAYYQRYAGTKLYVEGTMTVTGETFILRYTDGDAEAGIYVNGGTLNASVIYFYQGTISATNGATINTGVYWQTNETDGQGSANLVLDNATLNVSVYDHPAKATGNSTVTLTNGSKVVVAAGYEGAIPSMDATSKFVNAKGEDVFEPVATVNDVPYLTIEAALAAAKAGDTVTLLGDVTIEGTLTTPAGIIFNGNGKTVNGTLQAGGDLTFVGVNTLTGFSAGWYNNTITIGEGASLKVTGSRMTVSYGNVFNIIGTIADAKTADKSTITPSLELVAGISFNGNGGGVQFNVTNAYVVIGDSTTKNSGATGEFALNFTNSIVDFTKTLKTYMPTASGLAPVFNLTAKDSVVSFASHCEFWLDGTTVTLDNSDLTIGGSFANAGTVNVTNNSTFIVKAPIMSSHGGNTGNIVIDGGVFELKDSNQDWENAGTITVKLGGKLITNDFKCVGDGKIVVDVVNPENMADKTTVTVVDGNGVYDFANVVELKNAGEYVTASYENGDVTLTKRMPSGEIAYRGYINDTTSREAIQIDLNNVYAKNSFVIELYDANGNLLTVTTLKAGAVNADAYTCNIVLWGNASGSWDTTVVSKLTVANAPATIKVYADGILVDTYANALGAGTNVDETNDYYALDCVYKEAKIGTTYYATLADAIAAAKSGDVIVLLKDLTFDSTITVPAGKEITLDLNGKTITGTDKGTASFGLITNKGTLTITGNGVITLTAINNRGWNAYSSVISNQPGGKLIVENGTIEHLGGTDMAYAIDNLTNGKGTTAETIVNGGTIKSPYRAIRQFLNGVEAQNVLTVNGGTIIGANKSIWMQDPSANANSGTLTVGANAAINGDIYLSVTAGSTEWPVTVSIAAAALKGDSEVLSSNVPAGLVVEKDANGNYGVAAGLKGSGTEADPYLIGTAKELELFRASVNAGDAKYNAPGVVVALGANIDMGGATWERGIGDGINATFDGIFDGKNFTIENLNLAPEADSDKYLCGGLFGYTYGAVVIKNLVLENITVKTDDAGHNVGILVGFANNNGGKLTVSNVTVKNATIDAPNAYGVGAIVGYSYRAMGTIENCSVDGATITGYSFVGGITGYSYSDAVITGCSVTNATITATSKGAGGIAGLALNGTIKNNTIANTTVTAPTNWGYVVGELGENSAHIAGNTAAEPQLGGDYATGKPYAAKIGDKYYTSLADAIAAAKAGDELTLLSDLTVSDIVVIDKAITLDGNGKILTSTAARAINVSGANGVTIKNLIIKASGERAINVIQKATNVTIDNVTATASNYTVNVASSAANAVVAIKNSNLTGLNAVNVAAPNTDVTIDKTTITTVDNSTDEGYISICLNKDAVNGKIVATDTIVNLTGSAAGDSTMAKNGAEGGYVSVNGSTDGVKVDVAYISYGDTYYGFASLEAALKKAEEGETIVLIRDVTISSKFVITKSVTIDGNGKTLTYTGSDRAIDIPGNADAKVNVTIKNLTVDCTSSYCQRGINYNDDGKLVLNKVTVQGTNVTYALNLPGSSDNCVVEITDSGFTGNIALNVWGANSTITATNSEFVSVENSTEEGYVAISLNNDGAGNAATGSVVTINGGKIIAKDDKGEASCAVRIETEATVNVSAATEVVGSTKYEVVIVTYEGSSDFYSFENLQDAINKAANDPKATVKLLASIELNEAVKVEGTVVIDLNGKTITGTDNATGSFGLITNKGTLTITDTVGGGKITLTATNNRGWNAYSSVISNQPGGKLIVENGTIEHLGGTDMAYAIDNLTNGKGTYAETTINGGTIKSTYRAIRQFLNGVEAENVLTVNGGTIEGANKAIWMQDPSKNANSGTLTIGANAVVNGDVYLSVTAGSTEWPVEVSIAASAVNGNVLTSNVPMNHEVALVNGTYGVVEVIHVAKVGDTYYKTVTEAIHAAEDGATIYLLPGTITETIAPWAGDSTHASEKSVTILGAAAWTDGETILTGGLYLGYDDNGSREHNIVIEGITFEGKGILVAGQKNVTISNNVFRNITECVATSSSATENAISVIGKNVNAVVSGNVIENVKAGGIHLRDTASVVISENVVKNVGSNAITVPNNGSAGEIVITDNHLENWGMSGEGRAIRTVSGSSVTVNGNVMIHANAPEEFAKLTNAEDVDVSENYWNGENPMSGKYLATSLTSDPALTLKSYYTDAAKTDLVDIAASAVKIGNAYYATLQAAIDAAANGATITVLEDTKLESGVTVPAGKEITLDLNGKNLVFVVQTAEAFAGITNRGMLTIKDSVAGGSIYLEYQAAASTAYAVNTIVNSGTLIINGGAIENRSLANGQIGYAIDNNSTSADAILVIDGENVRIEATGSNYYDGIRLFCNSTAKENSVTVKNGFVSSIWMQNPSDGSDRNAKDVKGSVTVSGGVVDALYLEPSAGFAASVTGGTIGTIGAFETAEGRDLVGFITGGTFATAPEASFIKEGYKVEENNGAYGVVEDPAYGMVATITKDGATVYYPTLADAVEAAQNGDVIKLIASIELDSTITVAAGKEITLDLCGKTITGTDKGTASFGLITNKGTLTITDTVGGGKITLTATNNRGWNAYSSVISNQPGGKLIVENGTIEHLGGTDMAYAIDNLTNGKGTTAETIINGGEIKSTYRAIRQFLNGVEAQNVLTVNGGTIFGANKGIWMQDPSANANSGTLTIGANPIVNTVYLSVTAGSTEWPVAVDIAGGAVTDEITFSNVPMNYEVVIGSNNSCTVETVQHVVEINGKYYTSFQDALNQAQDGDTVTLVADVDATGMVLSSLHNIAIDLNGHNIKAAAMVLFGDSGHITDSGETKGVVQVPKGYLIMTHAGYPMLPVWNEEGTGYIFVAVKDQTVVSNVVDANGNLDKDSFTVDFRPSISGGGVSSSQVFGDGAADNDITFVIHIHCYRVDDLGNITDVEFISHTISDELIKTVYTNQSTVRVNVNGATSSFDYYGVEIQLVSGTGIVYQGVSSSQFVPGTGVVTNAQ